MPSHRKPTHRARLLVPALTVLLTVSGVSFAVHGAQEASRTSDEPRMAASFAPGTVEDAEERPTRPSRSARTSRPAVPDPPVRSTRERRPRKTATPTVAPTPSSPPAEATTTPTKVRSPEATAPTANSSSSSGGGDAPTTGSRSPILRATNAARTSAGLRSVAPDACLRNMAQQHAERLAASGTLYHQDLGAVASTCGTSSTAENVAMNHSGPSAMVDQWLDSPGHRANLLNGGFTLIGVGTARGQDGAWYGVQLFGAK